MFSSRVFFSVGSVRCFLFFTLVNCVSGLCDKTKMEAFVLLTSASTPHFGGGIRGEERPGICVFFCFRVSVNANI